MSQMRERLKQQCPELSQALERSWQIARNQWFSAIDAKVGGDSFNSFPHVRNLENYLDHVVEEVEKYQSTRDKQIRKFYLSPVEIYVICASIIFHDIGRTKKETAKKKHGSRSKEIIKENYANLGIPSQELADIIADICEKHKPDRDIKSELITGSVNLYGRIRCRELAALLILVDEMDSTLDRVIPNYLKDITHKDNKAAFRSVIQNICVDPSKQTLFTILQQLERPKIHGAKYKFKVRNKMRRKDLDQVIRWAQLQKKWEDLDASQIIKNVIGISKSGKRYMIAEYLARGLPWPEVIGEKNPWILLGMIIKAFGDSVGKLKVVKDDLARLGIIIRGWRLEFDEHLYDENGNESYEACFYPGYLYEVAQGMWDLSTRIFGISEFTYESLASAMRESDVEKIKMAVRRISLMTDSICKKEKSEDITVNPGIYAGTDLWKWKVNTKQKAEKPCDYLSLDDLKEYLKED